MKHPSQNRSMPSFQRLKAFAFLAIASLILAQCAEKTSVQYVKEGLEYLKSARYDDALYAYQKAAQANSKNPDAYYGMGGVYNQKEEYDLAKEAFLKTLHYDPTYVDAYYSLGYTYEMKGNMEEAQKYYEKYHSLGKKLNRLLERKRPKLKHLGSLSRRGDK